MNVFVPLIVPATATAAAAPDEAMFTCGPLAAPNVNAVGTEIAPAEVIDNAPLELYGIEPATVFSVTEVVFALPIVTLPVPANENVVLVALEVNVPPVPV